MVSEGSKVTALQWKMEQEAHHQRGTKTFFGRMDAALNEERGSHAQRNIEWGNEAEVEPVGAFEGDPFG